MTDSKVKRMDLTEFRDLGFLQEANRLFFHPLGLALEVNGEWDDEEKKGKFTVTSLGGVWDYRDDPEGMLFDQKDINKDQMEKVEALRQSKILSRVKTGECDLAGIQYPERS